MGSRIRYLRNVASGSLTPPPPTTGGFFLDLCVWMRGPTDHLPRVFFPTAEACCPHTHREREALQCIQQIFFPAPFFLSSLIFVGFRAKRRWRKRDFSLFPLTSPASKPQKEGFLTERRREKPLDFLPMYPPPPRRRDFIGRFSAKKVFFFLSASR